MTEAPVGAGRKQLLFIALVFFGPLLFAGWLYYSGALLQPGNRTNHGALLQPLVNLDEVMPESPLRPLHEDQWLLVLSESGPCADDCRQALYNMRQMRLMLGKEMDRLGRILLHGETAPDTVFPGAEYPGLILVEDGALAELLQESTPAGQESGGYYLVDPLGNLVMYFAPDLAPDHIVSDIKQLLKLSHIG
ncbi:MAG TPA: hypothetical protein PKK10_14665 [Woeseiaceae bacterium]|nr:hypothetical protein [Woeseiaceae bacterium]